MSKTMNFNRSRGKAWVHPPESLIRGQIVYTVKFLGCVEVDQPKGSEMVRDAIRKMKFNRQIKKAEGEKPMKVELNISIDAIKLQDPKYKTVSYQFPLHQVSYCADDKSDKRMFTFIAKEKEQNKHLCFVFDSEKSAEEITLCVGQAFDLAYRRFLEMSGRDVDPKKQLLLCQKKIQELSQENTNLKQRVAFLEKQLESKKQGSVDSQDPIVGRKLENLLLDSTLSANGNDPAVVSNGAHVVTFPVSPPPSDHVIPPLAPPPPIPSRTFTNVTSPDPKPNQSVDLFGATPFGVTSPVMSPSGDGSRIQPGSDAFGMEMFNVSSNMSFDLDQQIQNMDRDLLDAQANFSRGLSFGTEDFSLDDLDPLKK